MPSAGSAPLEAAVRCLRDGRLDGSSPAATLLLEDSLEVVGGSAVLVQVLADLCGAIAGGRGQAGAVRLAALQHPPARYAAAVAPEGSCVLQVLDGYTDPWGWLAANQALPPLRSAAPLCCGQELTTLEDALLARPGSAPTCHAGSTAGTEGQGSPAMCVVIDSVSTLLERFPSDAVVDLVERLRRHPDVSALVLGLHADLPPAPQAAALAYLATGVLRLQPLSTFQQDQQAAADGWRPSGLLQLELKRRTGRVSVETALFAVQQDGGVRCWQGLASETAAASAPKPGVATAEQQQQAALMQEMAGGMRLALTEQERRAREAVQLPYEHAGTRAAHWQADATAYLPPAAGGKGAGAGPGGLGHILYVRDSASEHDSDEDPDDDLDI